MKKKIESERWLHEKRLDKERLVSVHVALRTAFWQHALFAMNNTEDDCSFFEDQLHFDSTEELFITNIVTCILNSFFSLLTCIGNFIVVFVIGKTRDLHSPSFILLGCLAVSDLLVGLICQPLFVGYKIAELEKNFAVFCTLNVVQSLSGFTTGGVSFLILAAVSIDRLLALTLHLRYNTIVTVPRVFQTTIALWIFATVTVLQRFWTANKWYFIAIALWFITFFVIMISIWKIFRIVRKHQQQIKDQTIAVSHLPAFKVNIFKCRKSAVTVLYIYGLSLIFYLPFMVSLTMKIFIGYKRTVSIVYEYAVTAVFIGVLRGGSRIFFRRGCTLLLLYFNTSKPHSFFLQNTRSSRGKGGGGVRIPCTLPLDQPLVLWRISWEEILYGQLRFNADGLL